MAIPFILGIVAAGGAVATGGAMYDMNKANNINKEAQNIADNATNRRERTKETTNDSLKNLGKTKISIMGESMKRFAESYGKIKKYVPKKLDNIDELKNLSDKEFQELEQACFKASDMLKAGLGGIATGTLTAAGVCGLVSTFGVASTGTAISGLTGAAAAKATLAWLGGGAVTAGGGGIALGTRVLGGLLGAPALLIGGLYLTSKSDKALNEASANFDKARKYEQEIRNECSVMNAIKDRADQIRNLLGDLDKKFTLAVYNLETVINNYGYDTRYYDNNSVYRVIVARELAVTMKTILNTSLLREDGGLNEYDSQKALEAGRNALTKF